MRKFSLALLSVAIGLAASQASAADLPRKAPPSPLPPPPLTWTGCYVGVNVGAARGRFELDGPFGGSASRDGDWGFAGGGQIGCDYQFAGTGFVIGFRNMFDGTTNHRDRAVTVTGPGGLISATGTAELHRSASRYLRAQKHAYRAFGLRDSLVVANRFVDSGQLRQQWPIV